MVVRKVQATKSKLCNFGADFVMALTDIFKVLLCALYHAFLKNFTTDYLMVHACRTCLSNNSEISINILCLLFP